MAVDDYQYITFYKKLVFSNLKNVVVDMDLRNNLSFNTKGYSMDNMALHA